MSTFFFALLLYLNSKGLRVQIAFGTRGGQNLESYITIEGDRVLLFVGILECDQMGRSQHAKTIHVSSYKNIYQLGSSHQISTMATKLYQRTPEVKKRIIRGITYRQDP